MASVGIGVATYGDSSTWFPLAERAVASAESQAPCIWVHSQGGSLAEARNLVADRLRQFDFLIFLDGDDELSPGYVDAMLAAAAMGPEVGLFRPNTIGVYEDGSTDESAVMIPRTNMVRTNCVVIGAMVSTSLFHEVGGFEDWPVLEDWDLWQKVILAGAEIVDVFDAVYRIHIRAGSRNMDSGHAATYSAIRDKHAQSWRMKGLS